MTLSQIRRLSPGDHCFCGGQLVRVASPALVRRRAGIRVRVAVLGRPNRVIEAPPAECAPFGKLRQRPMSVANRLLAERLSAIASRRANG